MIGYIDQSEDSVKLHSEQPSIQENAVLQREIPAPENNSHTQSETQLVGISPMFFMVNIIAYKVFFIYKYKN